MNNKKAQGMPLNTIVIAAIVLVVMVVLILIFTGGIGKWGEDREEQQEIANARAECLGKLGTIKTEKECGDMGGYAEDTTITNVGKGFVCCIKKENAMTPKIGKEHSH